MGHGGGKGVQVLVRVRPMLARELAFDNAVEVLSDTEILVFKAGQKLKSSYAHVFAEHASQELVYKQLQGAVQAAFEGYNATVFAYGQTGTGKTYTLMGEPGTDLHDASPSQQQATGMIPRAVQDLFNEATLRQAADTSCMQILVSYMEIYNDRLYDLLQPYKPGTGKSNPLDMNKRKEMLDIREDGSGNMYVPNLLCVKVKSHQSILNLISRGNRNRAVRHTEMNINSSRSHAILQIVVEQWPAGGAGNGNMIRSKLNFVDLAGSERWSSQVQMEAERISELTAINSSLSTLSHVVAALLDRAKHIPYRDSKLTHLLQDSLGGNCCTTIIAMISPCADAFEETCSTLRFADRASNIGNNPVVNTVYDMNSVMAFKEKEIQRLRQLLSQYMANNPSVQQPGSTGEMQKLQEELEAIRQALQAERVLRSELEMRLQQQQAETGIIINADDPLLGTSRQSSPSLWPQQQQQQQTGSDEARHIASNPAADSRSRGYDYLRVLKPIKPQLASVHSSMQSDVAIPDTGDISSPLSSPATISLSVIHSRTSQPGRFSSHTNQHVARIPNMASMHNTPQRFHSRIDGSSSSSSQQGHTPLDRPKPRTSTSGHQPTSDHTGPHRSPSYSLYPNPDNPGSSTGWVNRLSMYDALTPRRRPPQQAAHHGSSGNSARSSHPKARAQRHLASADSFKQLMAAAAASISTPALDSVPVLPRSASPATPTSPAAAAAAAAATAAAKPPARLQPTLSALQSSPPAVGWGRSALLAKFTDSPMQSPAATAAADPSSPVSSWSQASYSYQPHSEAAAMVESAPSSGTRWGRSAILGAAPQSSSRSEEPSPAKSIRQTTPNRSQSQPKRSQTLDKPPSPMRFDKASWIYILGARTSSLKAKQIASSMSAW